MNFNQTIDSLIKNYSGTAAICVKNMKTGENFFYNENEVFPSASLIKLVVMGEVLRKADKGEITLDDKILVSDDIIVRGDGILKYLDPGHKFSVRELITLMIIISDNTAANVLIDLAKIDDVNKFSKDLGLNNTVLNRKMMDFKAAKEGKENVTSAADICTLLEKIYSGDLVSQSASKFMIDTMKRQRVNGRIDMFLPEGIVLAHKTGTLDKLEHDAGILYGDKSDCVMCILTKNGKTNGQCRRFIGNAAEAFYKFMF